jgi:hypothetical protein
MIDITFDTNTLEIEMREYNHLGDKPTLKLALLDLLNRACYSGETITLWEVKGDEKILIAEFHSAAKNR